jgi:LPS O-antigen subunit length determinant protein (WzzB/FepE family)
MIDPFTAFAAAQAAVKGIKAVIALGKDVQSASGDILKFFEAKDAVVKASTDPKKAGIKKSDTGAAMELVLNAHALQQAEKELQQYLIYSGNAQLWDQMLVERNRIQKERKAEELRLQKIREKKARELKQAMEIAFYCLVVLGIGGAVVSGTMTYVESTRS